MSTESARAFCVRMMSDDAFRDKLGSAKNVSDIADAVKEGGYDFTRHDLLNIISELTGQKIEMDGLKKMVCEVYEEEISSEGSGSTEAVAAWLDSLQ